MKHLFTALVFLFVVCGVSAQTVLFEPGTDNSNLYTYDGGWAPNETAELFRLGQSGATITGFDVLKMCDFQSWQNFPDPYVDVRLQVTFFGGFQTTYTGVGPQFTDPITTADFDLGPQNFVTTTWYSFIGSSGSPYFSLPQPVFVPQDLVGAQFTWLVDRGSGLTSSDHLELCFASSPSLVGDNGFVINGRQYEWIAQHATDSSTPLRQSSHVTQTTDNLSVRFYGTPVPEPSSVAALALSMAFLSRRRRVKRPRDC